MFSAVLGRPDVGPMAIHAIFRRGLIEQNRLALNLALQRVTHRASDVGMSSLQGKWRPFIVIEGRRRPPLDDVTIRALCDPVLRDELATMRVGMARFASLRCPFELDLMRALNRLMTVAARHRAVSPHERKFRLRMIEALYLDPGSRGVARLAAQRGPIGVPLRHAFLELTLVGIGVARRAGTIFEMERQDFVRSSAQTGLVAVRAGNGRMNSGKGKTRVLVLRNREGRAMKVSYRVAILATILVGCSGELLVMGVLVAIRAGREFDFILSVLARGCMALLARDGRMFSLQRIVRGGVLFHAEWRRLPAVYAVALRAFAFASPCLELALVRIREVAIRALGESQRAFEISTGMATAATYLEVHAKKRIFRFRMVELNGHAELLPPTRRVTGFAGSFEGSLMWVRMAGDAGIKLDSRILYGIIRSKGKVALVAGDLRVQASQRIFCLGMVELLYVLPVGEIVAALAVPAKLAFVGICVARDTFLRKAQKGVGEILALNQRSIRGNHVRGGVTFLALDTSMLIHERIAGQPMIELLERWLPMNQSEIHSVVFEVAPNAIAAIGIFHSNLRVESLMGCQLLSDFFMAVETFECWCARPELVAGRALRSAIQGLMCLGQRAGRYLGMRANPGKQDPQKNRDQWACKTEWLDKPAETLFPAWSTAMH